MQNIKWKKVAFEDEYDEFDRITSDITPAGSPDDIRNHTLELLKKSYSSGKLIPLRDDIWKKLENTDSWGTNTLEKANRAIKRNASSSGQRNISNVIDEIKNGTPRAPIILKWKNGYTLVAGNTRLMASNVMGIRPHVILMEIK